MNPEHDNDKKIIDCPAQCNEGITWFYCDGEITPERCEECCGYGYIYYGFEDQKDLKMEFKAEEKYGRYERNI